MSQVYAQVVPLFVQERVPLSTGRQPAQKVPHWETLSSAAQAWLSAHTWWFEVSQVCVQAWFTHAGV